MVTDAATSTDVETSKMIRRLNRSAAAPAGNDSTSNGSVGAPIMALTQSGEPVNSRISHDDVTTCTRCPRLKMMRAIHNVRNIGIRSGAIDDWSPVIADRRTEWRKSQALTVEPPHRIREDRARSFAWQVGVGPTWWRSGVSRSAIERTATG